MKTKLNRIKSALRESIEMAGKAVREPWINDGPSVKYGHKGRDLVSICSLTYKEKEDEDNATFIAHARTMTPIACKALLLAIEGLEQTLSGIGNTDNAMSQENAIIVNSIGDLVVEKLTSITSTWPDA